MGWIIAGLGFAVMGAFIVALCMHAPIGYQDEDGFHHGKDD